MRSNNERMRVSGFKNAKTTKPVGDYFIDDILAGIKDGKFREKVEQLRSIKDKNAYAEAKTNFPSVTLSGTFSQRNNKSLIKHSGLICLDIDNLEKMT